MKRVLAFVMVGLLVVVGLGVQSAQAESYYYRLTGISSGVCAGTPGNVSINNVAIARLAYLPAGDLNAWSGSAPYGFAANGGSGTFSIGPAGPGDVGTFRSGITTNPGAAPVSLTFVVNTSINGVPLSTTSITVTCTSEVATPIVSVAFSYGEYEGPTIPEGFVLRTITCDVAVFDQPGGSPVGEDMITAGQTWFVNPASETAADGSAWTEVFVSGYDNGYIPTGCVGAAPEGY